MPLFEPTHPLFSEVLVYGTAQVSVTFVHYLKSGQSLPPKNFILNRGLVVDSILRNTDAVVLALSNGGVPNQLIYDEAKVSYPQEGQNQRAPDYVVPPDVWKSITQVCIGSAYE